MKRRVWLFAVAAAVVCGGIAVFIYLRDGANDLASAVVIPVALWISVGIALIFYSHCID